MRYMIVTRVEIDGTHRHVIVEQAEDRFTSFPAEVGNPVYDSFLESQGLTDAAVQDMEPDVWHDMA